MTTQGPSGHSPEASTGRPVHGGVKLSQLRALGLRPEDVVDFSASVSPIGLPNGVWDAMRRVDLGAYPDPACLELRESLSQTLLPFRGNQSRWNASSWATAPPKSSTCWLGFICLT